MSGLALPLLRLLPALKSLDVNGSQRTDSGRWGLMLTDVNIETIAALTQLEALNMGGAIVSDAGMKALESLVNLQNLDLSRMEISDKGLEPLAKLTETPAPESLGQPPNRRPRPSAAAGDEGPRNARSRRHQHRRRRSRRPRRHEEP